MIISRRSVASLPISSAWPAAMLGHAPDQGNDPFDLDDHEEGSNNDPAPASDDNGQGSSTPTASR